MKVTTDPKGLTQLTRDRLIEVLDYDPETGVFTWKSRDGFRFGRRSDLLGRPAGGVGGKGYHSIAIDGKTRYSHRLAWLYMTGEWPAKQIDHVNGIKTDNRWCNLREASNAENQWNMPIPRHNTSGYRGVSFATAERRWVAAIQVNKRRIVLGRFRTAEEAAAARRRAEILHHGEFAQGVRQ